MTQDDIRMGEHRRIFLSITRGAPYLRHGVAVFLMVMVIPYVGVILALPPLLSVLALSTGKGKGLVPRVRRRVWLMGTFWLQLPWVVVGLAPSAYEIVSWRYLYSLGLPGELYEWPEVVVAVCAIAVFAACLWWWRRSVRRLARKAALASDDPILAWRSGSTRVALLSYALAGLVSILPIMMWTLDTFWPGWA